MDEIIKALTDQQKDELLKKYIEGEYKKDCESCTRHPLMTLGDATCMHYCIATADRNYWEPDAEWIIKDIMEGE